MGLSLDLLDQLTFYGAYHSNKWNQIIHFIFVPCIVWSTMVWTCYAGPLLPPQTYEPLAEAWLPPSLAPYAVPNIALAGALLYSLFFLCLEPFVGATWTAFVGLPLWLMATAFAQQVPAAWQWATALWVFSWYMQIHPGHVLLEKRRPALWDSVLQAFATAPLFVWFELLFFLGYRPKLHRELLNRVGKDVAAYRRGQRVRTAFAAHSAYTNGKASKAS